MITVENIFGKGTLFTYPDVPIFFSCAACTSIYAEALSWANKNRELVTRSPELAKSIVVLSCQVTDMSVLNDIETVERYQKEYPKAQMYVGGCLARRFDIELPEKVLRLDHLREDYQFLYSTDLVHYEDPFWVDGFGVRSDPEGTRFRHDYPLRIGVGCSGKCTYCTIKETRGKSYHLATDHLTDEFVWASSVYKGEPGKPGVTLISDAPTAGQLKEWCDIAGTHSRCFSIRNIEPQVALAAKKELLEAAAMQLIRTIHIPIQSTRPEVLENMHRDPMPVELLSAHLLPMMKEYDVCLATNIIIDYKGFENPSKASLKIWDTVDWNPYWDGNWDRKVAEGKMRRYFPWRR